MRTTGNRPGIKNSNARFNASEVRHIRKLWRAGMCTAADLAVRFNVSIATIDRLVNAKTYQNRQYNAVELERRFTRKGEKNNMHKLTNKQVRKIKKSLCGKRGELTELGKQFNVARNTIADIRNGSTWGHIV